MEITKEGAIAKIIFWQQAALIILVLFLCMAWGYAIYDINRDLEFGYYESYEIEIGCYIFFCSLGTYNIYLLYKSLSLLKTYQKKQEHLDLEVAFRKQRHFWMIAPIILMFLVAILIIALILLTINLYK